MPALPLAPSVFMDDDDLSTLVLAFSERLRGHRGLRPMFDRTVGNRWEEFEQALDDFVRQTLFATGPCDLDLDWLATTVPLLDRAAIAAACEVFLETCMTIFPLHASAALDELSERVGELMRELIASTNAETLAERIARVEEILRSGALLGHFATRAATS